ncbi:Autophagy protein 22 [Aspergillus alliaceus]|nr:Autophagy protein 22 [Aspergillus burnettii]
MREDCPGYRDEWDLIFRNQTGHTIKRLKEKRANKEKTILAKDYNSGLKPPPSLNPSHEELGVNYFLHNFVTSCQSPSSGYLNYIPAPYTADGHHPTLVASMAAVGLVTLANTTRQPVLAKHARVKYSEAINQVNIALASPAESIKDSTLMSVISLGLFEHVSDFASWARHVRGAAALVVARGKGQFSTRAAILMFNQVRADMVAACIQGDQPFPKDMAELQEEASKHVDTTTVFWRLGVVATQCTNLLWDVRNRGESYWPGLLEQATVLQAELQHIFGTLSMKCPYTTFRKSGGDPAVFYKDRFDLYPNSWAIRVWNNTRILQTTVCGCMSYLLNQILATDLEPAVQRHMELQLLDTLEILSKLGNDTIATVPQALGVVYSPSEMSHAIDVSCHTNGSAGYMLTWCLYAAGNSSVVDSEARKWIIQRLQDFGHFAGITLALQLVEDLIRRDQLVN